MKRVFLFTTSILFYLISYGQFTMQGKVTDNKGTSLNGVNIIIAGSSQGSYTNNEGVFKFKNLAKDKYSIQISHIGFENLVLELKLVSDTFLDFILKEKSITTEMITIEALRASEQTPVSYSTIDKTLIEEHDQARDIPYLISLTSSAVASSDAGTGVGYSYISIRGSGAKRINVTVDDVPINDPESHAVYWVNMPDLISSVNNVQVQRGVGTSTNGSGAFGASINFRTDMPETNPHATVSSSFGSFNTFKNNISAGTGLLNNKFTIDTRLSEISSEGYIDRAASELSSMHLSASYYGDKTTIRAKILSGAEKTYQAWWGVPKVRLNNDQEGMQRYLDHWLYDQDEYDNMINSDSRTYNYYTYDNEVDDYKQNHYHLSFNRKLTHDLGANITFHYTKGQGFYENYKKDKALSDYQIDEIILQNDTIGRSDLIQQKWLDNDFYGITYALKYKHKNTNLSFGGSANKYIGDHFGKVIWARFSGNSEMNHEWYNNRGKKSDINFYGRINQKLNTQFELFTDLQYRRIGYTVNGIHDDLSDISMTTDYDFFNPKFGITYTPTKAVRSYFSVAVANREPSRRNFVDAKGGDIPSPEKLTDYELGFSFTNQNISIGTNLYFMYYNNQLVLTGRINNVGDAILTNVNESYRAGIELMSGFKINETFECNINATFSKNKISNFFEYVDNWDTGEQDIIYLGETDIAFSPDLIINGIVSYNPVKDLSISLSGNYVGKQYIDNTSSNDRILDNYFVNDLQFRYKIKTKIFSETNIQFCLNREYESYAWAYRYLYGGESYTMDGYFPQAGRNFLIGLTIGF